MSSMPDPEVEFFGIKVPKGKSVVVNRDDSLHVEDAIIAVHATQVALGNKAQPGKHTVFVEVSGEKYAIGTLEKDRCEQFQVDYMATKEAAFSHTGESAVFITGYRTITPILDDEDDDDDMPTAYEMSDDSEEEDEDEPVPRAVTIPNGKPQQLKALSAKGQMLAADAGDESDEEPDSDDEDDDAEDGEEMVGQEFSDMDDDDDDDEEELAPAAAAKPGQNHKQPAAAAGKRAVTVQAGDDDDDDDDDLDEDDDDEDDEDDDEEPPAAKPAAQGKGQKRPATAAQAATPQPQKKAKNEAATKAPATAPAKVQGKGGKSGEAAQFEAALKQHLTANGPTKLPALGTAVKRPASVPKLKKFLEDHADMFKIDGQQVVSLA